MKQIKHNNGIIRDWFYNNSWNLLITFTGIILGFALLKFQVDSATKEVDALQVKFANYPSEQYFELKFQVQGEKITSLEKKIDELNIDLKKHLQQ